MNPNEVLKIIGYILLFIGIFLALNFFAIWQVTRDMTEEEKDRFYKYIEENGILGHDDDDFP